MQNLKGNEHVTPHHLELGTQWHKTLLLSLHQLKDKDQAYETGNRSQD
jgi:hypothetical protein